MCNDVLGLFSKPLLLFLLDLPPRWTHTKVQIISPLYILWNQSLEKGKTYPCSHRELEASPSNPHWGLLLPTPPPLPWSQNLTRCDG